MLHSNEIKIKKKIIKIRKKKYKSISELKCEHEKDLNKKQKNNYNNQIAWIMIFTDC